MANSKRMHITYNKQNQNWQAKREGAERVSVTAETKAELDKIARQIAINNKLELVTHNKDGKISNSDSFGNDPYLPKDAVN